ncbi:Vacuolar protein sorting-associated protein 53 [Datura stramonium]|uniref:Vacuolar protein sorting-associated protein 53 n=1 Tax=Datura stramonium TaxID=4076 RepID=A0ABS8UUR0_DATST|nr:Vacuolar protein sorting-associated protein 53 [Datura stramonium]
MAASDKQNTLDYINQMFPTEASLSGVEPLMQKIHSEIRRVDAEILTAVRQQSNSGTKAREDLAAATSAVQELMNKIREIKTKAEQSETMVQEICRDIKKLDFAKKHITTTITALHRLTMLVSAVEQLQVMASKRHYKEAAAQLEAVNQLCSHFEAYRDIPKITELREKFKSIKQVLKSHVFSDFSRWVLETRVILLSEMIGKYFLEKYCTLLDWFHLTCLLIFHGGSYAPLSIQESTLCLLLLKVVLGSSE